MSEKESRRNLQAIASRFSYLLDELDSMFATKLLLWINKNRAIIKNAEEEEKDVFNYIERELIPFLRNQKKQVDELLSELRENSE